MLRLEVYIGNDNRLRVAIFNNSRHETQILRGINAYDCIESLYNYKILGVEDNDTNVLLRFNNCTLTLNEYDRILENSEFRKIFMPIFVNLKRFEENKKISSLKKKKVKRKNKYDTKKIIAAGLVTFVLASVSIKTLNVLGFKPNIGDIIDNSYIVNYENNDKIANPYEIKESDLSIYLNDESEVQCVSISYEDKSCSDKAQNADNKYRSLIDKYSRIYGLDTNLIVALATQERGVHSGVMDAGGATGLMQIQNSVWANSEVDAYNFETDSWEKIVVNSDSLSDLNYNIKVGCMIFQTYLREMNYNVLATLQSYNMGPSSVRSIINYYCADTNKAEEEVINNPYDIGWLDYRNLINFGDQKYIENVLAYYGNSGKINVTKLDGQTVSLAIENDIKEKMY